MKTRRTRIEAHRLTQWDVSRPVSVPVPVSDAEPAESRSVAADSESDPKARERQTSADYSVRDPVLATLLAVQAGKIGGLTALYAIRALVEGGWPEVGA